MKSKNKSNNIFISVGIPTYEAGESLVTTLRAIYSQTIFKKFVKVVILIVDGNKISKSILKKIKHPNLKIIYGDQRKGQSTRINDIFDIADTELLVLTNDDVILARDALEKILYTSIKSSPDLITTDVKPIFPTKLFQKIIYSGFELKDTLSLKWNKGNNYLSCNGRMMCLSKKLYKKIIVPEKIWNNDAFIYLFSKTKNYKVRHANGAYCYYLLPYSLKDHIRQSTKFKASLQENGKYFNKSINEFYNIPPRLILANLIRFFLKNPFRMIMYALVYLITTIYPTDKKINKDSYWPTDKSTKYIGEKIV